MASSLATSDPCTTPLSQFPPINCYVTDFLQAQAGEAKPSANQAVRTPQELVVNADMATPVKQPRKTKNMSNKAKFVERVILSLCVVM